MSCEPTVPGWLVYDGSYWTMAKSLPGNWLSTVLPSRTPAASDQVAARSPQCPAVRKKKAPPPCTLNPSEQRTPPPKMGSPPVMRWRNVPATRSTRAAPPSLAAAAWTLASFAPVTVSSTETSTWVDTGSTAHAVPGTRAVRYSVSVACRMSAPLRDTVFGTPPAARTVFASAALVTVTTRVPLARSKYEPALREPSRSDIVAATFAGSG